MKGQESNLEDASVKKEEMTDEEVQESTEGKDEEVQESTEGKDEEVQESTEGKNQEEKVEDMKSKSKKLNEENNFLKNDNEKLNNELETLKDRLTRITAEYDNYRKRTSKEKEGIYSDACEDVLKQTLPVLDNLERALMADGNVEDIQKGIKMTIKQFQDALENLNVEEISTEKGFNPNVHNAVMHVEDDKLDKNQVAEVLQKGYKRGDKVIRYSMVKVAN